jgi:hypothetical protein
MMEPMDSQAPGTPDDDELLAALREVAARVDPVPDDVVLAARSAIAYRRMDAGLAELLYDSAVAEDRLAGVRGDDGGWRQLTFEGPGVTIDLEVVPEGGRRRVNGQLVPPGVADLRLRHPGGEIETTADELGRFSAEGIRPGPLSIRLERDGADPLRIETGWVTV